MGRTAPWRTDKLCPRPGHRAVLQADAEAFVRHHMSLGLAEALRFLAHGELDGTWIGDELERYTASSGDRD